MLNNPQVVDPSCQCQDGGSLGARLSPSAVLFKSCTVVIFSHQFITPSGLEVEECSLHIVKRSSNLPPGIGWKK
jgi:hypothetical protein